MELTTLIQQVELFRGLNDEQVKQFSQIFKKEIFAKGATIFSQGTIGDKMFVIGKGQIEVRVHTSDGGSYALLYLGHGQVFGEMALIDSGMRSATVISADDETTVYSIPSVDFEALCKANTAIGYVLMRNIAQDLSFKLRHRDFDPTKN